MLYDVILFILVIWDRFIIMWKSVGSVNSPDSKSNKSR